MATPVCRWSRRWKALVWLASTGACSVAAAQRPGSAMTAARLDSVIAPLIALEASPGVGIVVVRDSQIIYMKGFGWADVEAKRPFTPKTVFYIASTTKSFTGLTAAILSGSGRFSLDAPLSRYLPHLELRPPLDPRAITIRSLLTHTHGIENDGPVVVRLAYTGQYSGNDHLVRLLAVHRRAESGTEYRYGNIGYNVAALAMDAATAASWKEMLERTLFTPLKMTSTSAHVSKFSRDQLVTPYRTAGSGFAPLSFAKADANMHSAGGLVTTLEDMARWLEVHINGGRVDGRQILPEAAVAEAHRNLAPFTGNRRGLRQVGYGLGWELSLFGADTLLNHGGGFPGFATHMSFMPQQRIGVAVFSNTNLGGGVGDNIAYQIYNALTSRPTLSADSLGKLKAFVAMRRAAVDKDLSTRASRPQTLPLPLNAYAGTYDNPVMGRVELLPTPANRLEARMGTASSTVEAFNARKHQLRLELLGGGTVVQMFVSRGRADSLTMDGFVYRRRGRS
jgi:CubicO group peptidase (beta-lactamase class C family)